MAKRLLSAFMILSLFFGLGYLHKHFKAERSDGLSPLFFAPIAGQRPSAVTPSKQSVSAKGQVLNSAVDSDKERKLMEKASGAELFSYLFDGEFERQGRIDRATLEVLKARFSQPYSKEIIRHVTLADRQASDRMGILKAWGKKTELIQDKNLRAEVVRFYESVASNKNENLLVRRQALRSLMRNQFDLTESQRMAQMARQDRRLMGVAALSDEEIIEAVLEK